jgi:hypothetical protein
MRENKMKHFITFGLASILMLLLVACGDEAPEEKSVVTDPAPAVKDDYGPGNKKPIPRNVYWGDTHLHTSFSPDASLTGNIKLGPAEAYYFARGGAITAHNGMKARLDRPLDFLVVSDHSEYLGFIPMVRDETAEAMNTKWGKYLSKEIKKGGDAAYDAAVKFINEAFVDGGVPELKTESLRWSPWNHIIAAADKANTPGIFTAFIGYEWTSHPGGDNLHRVVIFRDDATKAKQVLPFSALDSEDPEDLWKYLESYEAKTGGQILAIAHNGNVSNGHMFAESTRKGEPLSKSYAEQRAKWEPLFEITQIKGDGEAHPLLSPTDEFADYENWDKGNLLGNLPESGKTLDMLRHEYGREALKIGLKLEGKIGANPFKFGLIGSTDAHTSMASADSANFWGKLTLLEPDGHRWDHVVIKSLTDPSRTTWGWEQAASGYAGVWATENTREDIFDAMERRETYATTGPRIIVRFFGGWNFTDADVLAGDIATIGYGKGVPMGGDLPVGGESKSPNFLIAALKDPIGANLDRVQVIKGWVDAKGKTHERIYDVAVSDGRKIGNDGRARKPVGSTVDIAKATWRNSIGDSQLSTVWQDPEFDPALRAFYYVRVIEIPTPRWTAYDAKIFNVKMDPKVPMSTQERAYTSPIWYTPK